MYLVLSGVCLLFSAVLGAVIPKKPCCWDPQHEMVKAQFQEYYSSRKDHYVDREGSEYIVYDNINERESVITIATETDKKKMHYRRVFDYKNKIEYFVHTWGNCTKRALNGRRANMEGHCLPPTAVYLGSSYYGSGEDKLEIDTWTWIETGQGHVVKFDVTPIGCIPVSKTRRGHYTSPHNITNPYMFVHMWGFLNYEVGIRDDHVFDIPLECKPVPGEHSISIVG